MTLCRRGHNRAQISGQAAKPPNLPQPATASVVTEQCEARDLGQVNPGSVPSTPCGVRHVLLAQGDCGTNAIAKEWVKSRKKAHPTVRTLRGAALLAYCVLRGHRASDPLPPPDRWRLRAQREALTPAHTQPARRGAGNQTQVHTKLPLGSVCPSPGHRLPLGGFALWYLAFTQSHRWSDAGNYPATSEHSVSRRNGEAQRCTCATRQWPGTGTLSPRHSHSSLTPSPFSAVCAQPTNPDTDIFLLFLQCRLHSASTHSGCYDRKPQAARLRNKRNSIHAFGGCEVQDGGSG